MTRTSVGLLGASGLVGQRFAHLLDEHPWFQLTELVGSERSAGRRYGEATSWQLEQPMPAALANMLVQGSGATLSSNILFSALPGPAAKEWEPVYADRGHWVFSNASAFRLTGCLPPIVPEVNGGLLAELAATVGRSAGRIVTNPNCVVAGVAGPLAALDRAFGLTEVTITTLQALSGAGLRGVSGLTALGNVVPHISGEGVKIGDELQAILGRRLPISVAVHRVPVRDGHMMDVRARLATRPSIEALRDALANFGRPDGDDFPSAPSQPIRLVDEPGRPQHLLDLYSAGGMATTAGQITQDEVFDARVTLLVHNTIRGAAGGSLLNAELAVAEGLAGPAKGAKASSGHSFPSMSEAIGSAP